ncbi:unnamed protein product [Linum trigynum]|uniref:Uncharacterized protein n=1 Tax=Linum trigynum TaxID=586398 RepID=A0AAV2FBY8_9ROSI
MSSRNSYNQQYYSREASSSDDCGYCYYPPKREEVMARYERASSLPSPKVCVTVADENICSENVDSVAEEFIKMEHKKFEWSKTMSSMSFG